MAGYSCGKLLSAIQVMTLAAIVERWCSRIGVEVSRENDRTDIDEKPSIVDMLVFASDID